MVFGQRGMQLEALLSMRCGLPKMPNSIVICQRQRELMAGHGMSAKDEENEAKMQRVLNMFMGGKKGNAKKFFRCWTIGVMMVKKERLVMKREARERARRVRQEMGAGWRGRMYKGNSHPAV